MIRPFGFDRAAKRFAAMGAAFPEIAANALLRAAEAVLPVVQAATPVDTGETRRRWYVQAGKPGGGILTVRVDHPFNEEGTIHDARGTVVHTPTWSLLKELEEGRVSIKPGGKRRVAHGMARRGASVARASAPRQIQADISAAVRKL
jgi:hypothetical protein